MRSFGLRMLALVGVATVALSMVGCGGSGGGVPAVAKPVARYVNASPDSTALDFLLNDKVKATSLPFGGSTADFAEIQPPLNFDLIAQEHGQVDQLVDEVFTPANGHSFVLVAVGLENPQGEELKRIRFATLDVDRTVPNGNKARLIVLHAFNRPTGFDTPNIDFQTPGDNPQFSLSDISFAASKTIVVDSGTQTFQARRAGSGQIYAEKSLVLDPGKVYLVIVNGIQDEVGAKAPDITLIPLSTKS